MALIVSAVVALAAVSAAVVWFSVEHRPPADDVELAIRWFQGFDVFVILAALILGATGYVNVLDSRIDLALFALAFLGAASHVFQARRGRGGPRQNGPPDQTTVTRP